MRGFAAVLGREILERRLLGALALGLGLVPLAVVWLPGLAKENHDDVRNSLALMLAVGLSAVLAILLGGSVVSRDLGEGRLGFYFSRPLRGWAIWAGKLGAVLVLSLGSALLVALPAALWNGHLPDLEILLGNLGPGITWALLGLLILCLILLSHTFSVMLRARTAWLALDFAGAAAFAVLVWDALHRLGFYGAHLSRPLVLSILSGLGLVGLLAAGARQVTAGRTDARRAHRALSLTLWGGLLAGALGAQGFTYWVLAGTPRDLRIDAAVSLSGSWIEVDGADPRRHLASTFLVDRKSGRFYRLLASCRSFALSADGRWVIWPELVEGEEGFKMLGPVQLSRLDLRRPGATPFRSNIEYPRWLKAWALSPDGSLVAAILDRKIVIDDIDTGSRLAAVPLPYFEETPALQFVGPGRIQLRGVERRTYLRTSSDETWRVWAMDVTRGHPWSTGGFEDLSPGPKAVWSDDGSRVLRSDARKRTVELLDGWTGRPLAQIPWEGGEPGSLDFLSSGRIAVVTSGDGGNEIRVLSPDLSRELRRCRLGRADDHVLIVGQPAQDLLTVETVPKVPEGRKGRLLLLDLGTGSTRELRRDVKPAGARLFLSRGGHLFELDPKTGELRPALGPEEKG